MEKRKLRSLTLNRGGGGGGEFLFFFVVVVVVFFLPSKVLFRAKSDKFDYFIWLKANLKQIGEFC